MNKLKYIVLSLLATFSVSAHAQLTLNAESGNRNTESANCWAFGAVSYTNSSSLRITGSWSMRSNSLTNPNAGACWIKSPFFKPGSGNITLKARHENTTGSTRGIRVRFIKYNSANLTTGEGDFIADSLYHTFTTPFNTSTIHNITFAIPTSIANSNDPYKVMFSFVGTGGTNRIISDDIVIPGTYWANPPSCLPLPTIVDTDLDGVADADDAYPTDRYKAFNNYLVSSNYGTLMYEDLWPSRGDYDFNDLVVDYRINTISNASNQVVEMQIKVVARAAGASFKDAFAIEWVGIEPNKILSVTGNNLPGTLFTTSANGTESGQTHANIPVFDDIFKVLEYKGGSGGINTDPAVDKAEYDTLTLVVKFKDGATNAPGGNVNISDITFARFNPYIVVNQERGREVHLADKAPTSKANTSLFGTKDDNSNVSANRYYKTVNNLPWALAISQSIPYAKEKTDISSAFQKFLDWAESSGASYNDWYENKTGYRNTNSIYNK